MIFRLEGKFCTIKLVQSEKSAVKLVNVCRNFRLVVCVPFEKSYRPSLAVVSQSHRSRSVVICGWRRTSSVMPACWVLTTMIRAAIKRVSCDPMPFAGE